MRNMASELEVRGGLDAAVLTEPLRYLARLAEEDPDSTIATEATEDEAPRDGWYREDKPVAAKPKGLTVEHDPDGAHRSDE